VQKGVIMCGFKKRKEFIEELCTDTWMELYRYIYYKVQNREEAQDITQESYVKAITYLMNNDLTVHRIDSYLKCIALNIIRDRWRKKKKNGFSVNIDEANEELLATEDFTDYLAEQDEVEKALEVLTKDQQMVISLRIIKGFSVEETARLMNKKKGTVRVLQFRALKQLEKLLARGD